MVCRREQAVNSPIVSSPIVSAVCSLLSICKIFHILFEKPVISAPRSTRVRLAGFPSAKFSTSMPLSADSLNALVQRSYVGTVRVAGMGVLA